jgi:hypothetical protein
MKVKYCNGYKIKYLKNHEKWFVCAKWNYKVNLEEFDNLDDAIEFCKNN